MTAVHDDRVAWGELDWMMQRRPCRLAIVAQRRVVVASYQSNGERSVRRSVSPGLVNKAGAWYLIC